MKQKIALFSAIVALILATLGCATSGATPTATSLPPTVTHPPEPADILSITSTNAFVDSYGTYRVVGEVVNNGSNPVTSVELTVEIKDASGNSLLKDDNGNTVTGATLSPMLYTLAPGEGSPFEYSYDTNNGTPATYNVTVTGQQTGSADRATIKHDNVQLVDDGAGWFYLTGELVNTGTKWAHINSLAGAVQDASSNVLSADWTSTYTTELAPAGDASGRDRTPFEASFPNPGSGASQWALYWDADNLESVTDYPMAVTLTNGYFDQYGSFHVVGWLENGSTSTLNSLMVAGLYADDNTTLDASYSFIAVPIRASAKVAFNISSFSNVDYNQAEAARLSTYTAQADPWFTYPPVSEPVDLSDIGGAVKKDGATLTFSGNVTNTSGQSLTSFTVVAMVMDASNNLVAVGYTTVYPTGEAIAAGDSNEYSVTVELDPNVDATGFSTSTLVLGEVK
jgi:hypothetical protein